MNRNDIYKILEQYGTTAAADNVTPIFKTAAGYDSESTTITVERVERVKKDGTPVTKTYVKHCFCYAWQYAIDTDGAEIPRTSGGIIELLRETVAAVQFYNKLHDTDAVLLIGVANLAHEWAFIKKAIADNFEITKIFGKSKRDILYIQIEGCVEFREIIGLLGHSLDDISKHWCAEDNRKLTGEFDYSKIRTSSTPLDPVTELPYMIHDVTSIVEAMRNAIKHYTQADGVCVLPYTSSGFVRQRLKNAIREDDDITAEREHYNFIHNTHIDNNVKYIKRRNRVCVTDAYQWHVCRDYGYAGGLCGSNIDLAGKVLKNVVCADLTSDYPAQLSHKKYPSGRLRRIGGNLNKRRRELDAEKRPYFCILQVSRLKAKTQHAALSEHKLINGVDGDKTVFPWVGEPKNLIVYNGKIHYGENLLICVNDVDIAAYSELYDIRAGVLALWAFDKYAPAPPWLLSCLWDDYETKSLLKMRGLSGTQDYNDSKVRCNTYYGVLATRIQTTLDALDLEYNLTNASDKTFKDIKNNFWLNPYIAFYCTSYARAVLMHFIARFPDSIVQYDTDSLYYIRDGNGLENALKEYNAEIERKNKMIFRDREHAAIFDTLGTWDFENVYKKFLGMGAKKYIKEDADGIHTTIAGLPKNAIPREIEERGIKDPFNYYNPLVKYMRELSNDIIIKHTFAHKFASVYGDDVNERTIKITDHTGRECEQVESSYHAIIPIDFTLSMAYTYIKHIIKRRG